MAGRRRAGRRPASPRSAGGDRPGRAGRPDLSREPVESRHHEFGFGSEAPSGLGRAIGLTFASAFIWGLAHRGAGRHAAGTFLVTAFITLGLSTAVGAVLLRGDKEKIATSPQWLAGFTVGMLTLALIWATVVLRSYQVLRPGGLTIGSRVLSGGLVVALAMAVCTPLVWGARKTYAARDGINTIFDASGPGGQKVNGDDPWKNKPRVNVLLLGGDSHKDRAGQGVRTDSVTLASIDTKTGDAVLLSLPRNLQYFEMPPRLQHLHPNGFNRNVPGSQGLLNELYNYAVANPSVVPSVRKKERRGPELIKQTVSHLMGLPIDYYILVDMVGFSKIVDAMGGVRIKITQPIRYGQFPERIIPAGNRKLKGQEALWYGRSRTGADDFIRMGRQKCLMKAMAEQADPFKVLRRFEDLVKAAKETISTDIPQPLLAPLIKLSSKAKSGSDMKSLQLIPPVINNVGPDVDRMHQLVAKAIADSGNPASPTPNPTKTKKPGTNPNKPTSLKDTCPK